MFPRTVTRRSMTPTPPLTTGELHGTRRQQGGARHEMSERCILRRGPAEVTGWTLNVSRGGVRLIVEDPIELGVEYAIAIAENSERAGRIVWVQDEADGQIVGVQFLDVDGSAPPPPDTK